MYLAELENAGLSYCYLAREDERWGGRFLLVLADSRRAPHQQPRGAAGKAAIRRRHGAAAVRHARRVHASARSARRSKCGDRTRSRARLYERFGFAVAGVRRAYYTHPVEDALVLWREQLGRLMILQGSAGIC